MARSRRRLAAAAALLVALASSATPAAALRALHVDALSMRADRSRLTVGEVFHLAIHAHVREKVSALDELVIPDVGTLQIDGDERNAATGPSGTDIVETLTLEPTQPGAYTIPPAYLDAIDARTGKPSRFSSNPVRVVVTARSPLSAGAPGVLGAIRTTLLPIALVFAVVLAFVVALWIVRTASPRRSIAPVSPAVAPSMPAAPPRTPRDAVRDALAVYRVTPSAAALMQLRAALFAAAGASSGATLRDALAATHDGALRTALTAAERAAFGPAFARDAASDDLIAATETWLR